MTRNQLHVRETKPSKREGAKKGGWGEESEEDRPNNVLRALPQLVTQRRCRSKKKKNTKNYSDSVGIQGLQQDIHVEAPCSRLSDKPS